MLASGFPLFSKRAVGQSSKHPAAKSADNGCRERDAAAMSDIAIELRGIDKSFGPVHANKHIDLVVKKGTIHGIIGENGAGKSTLMSILYGFYQADHGEILIDGKVLTIKDPNAAIASGIGMVHQHFML